MANNTELDITEFFNNAAPMDYSASVAESRKDVNKMKTKPDSMVEKVKTFIRQPYTWPGGYPLYAIANDCEPLCKCCAKSEYPLILAATKDNDKSGWNVIAVDVNWEDNEMYCSHCGEQIESAYGDDEEVDEVDE